ncbi:MAG: CDP-glycerol glycerophosphotransferase family protein, partial [Candidatus Aureabacteria bacterium]|nr:CDP-glycerol glycerophosphotransferase family protein [Candidatus Auribacterota bacterium]
AKKILSMANLLIIRLKGDGDEGGRKIIYSCALKFMEPLLDETHGRETIYYLRPVFSLKAFRMGLKKSASRLLHVLPEYFLSFREILSLRSKVNPKKISAEVDNYFKKTGGLNYNGFDLWRICGPDVSAFLKKELRDFAKMVSGLNKMIESVNPGLLINDEDTTPFNKALVECAKKKGIPSIQMNHGILGHHLLKVPINSDVIAVFGESSLKRLVGWGVEKGKIALTGAPCYSKISARTGKHDIKNKLCSEFGLGQDTKLVMLASSPFRTEERSDFIDTFLIPDNIKKVILIAARALHYVKNAKLIIKLHPREQNEWFTHNLLRKHDLDKDVIILKNHNIFDLLHASDLILSYGTTVFLEALLVKKPVLIFDDRNKKFLNFLSDDYLDLLDDKGSIRRIRKLLQDSRERENRLRRQEKELLWHFINKNEDSVERFHKLCDGMLAGAAERKAE